MGGVLSDAKLVEKFDLDIDSMVSRVSVDADDQQKAQLVSVSEKLKKMYKKSLVKTNHSVLEVLVASYFVKKGYQVDVEHPLDSLVCDIYAQKGDGSLIVEIETGFVPPDHALDPVLYMVVRLISKVARYSKYSNRFMLATPVDNFAQLHPALVKRPKDRSSGDLLELKRLCDKYYSNPPISADELSNARLHGVIVVNVDEARVIEMEPERYFELVEALPR
jgi:hypothetical protein